MAIPKVWIDLLDGLARQAGEDARHAEKLLKDGPDDATVPALLLAIVGQLAYGNAVAAAEFDLRNRNWEAP